MQEKTSTHGRIKGNNYGSVKDGEKEKNLWATWNRFYFLLWYYSNESAMKLSREQKTTCINHTTAESVGEMITTVTSFLLLLSLTSFFVLHSFTQSLIPDLTVSSIFLPTSSSPSSQESLEVFYVIVAVCLRWKLWLFWADLCSGLYKFSLWHTASTCCDLPVWEVAHFCPLSSADDWFHHRPPRELLMSVTKRSGLPLADILLLTVSPTPLHLSPPHQHLHLRLTWQSIYF